MAAPRMLVEPVLNEAITFGTRATWLAFAAVPRSTMDVMPDPPGVIIAQFSRGSMAIDGLGPVLTGRVFEPEIVEQLLGMFGLEPPMVHTRLGGFVDRSKTVAIFEDEYATTARCVSEFTPMANGAGDGELPVGFDGSATVETPCVCKFTMDSELSALLTTAATCKISSTPMLVGEFPTGTLLDTELVSTFSKLTLPEPWLRTAAIPSEVSKATATGCVPTVMGALAEVGTSAAEGEIATLTKAVDGEPLGTSEF